MEKKKWGDFQLPWEIKHIYTLIFYFIQTQHGETQQGSAGDILQFPGLILLKHIKFSENINQETEN